MNVGKSISIGSMLVILELTIEHFHTHQCRIGQICPIIDISTDMILQELVDGIAILLIRTHRIIGRCPNGKGLVCREQSVQMIFLHHLAELAILRMTLQDFHQVLR